jgi:MFS family permease
METMPTSTLSPTTSTQKPTQVRYGVLMFACLLSMITYLDRAAMGAAKGPFQEGLGLDVAQMGWVFGIFTLAYALFEVPSGWLGDVFGPRKVLIRIVLWWSLFTAVTGVIGLRMGGIVLGGYGLLLIVRLLFGIGEAGAYPNITRALHNWFPLKERGFAQGAVWMCGRLAGGLTPLIWMLLVEGVAGAAWFSIPPLMGWTEPLLPAWRSSFLLFGLLGVIWCFFFMLWFRNRPEEKPQVNAAELALIRTDKAESQAGHANVPWRRLLSSRSLWFLCMMYFCQAYGWWFFPTFMPHFMEIQYGVQPGDALGAVYKGGPLLLGAAGCIIGGFLTDAYVRRTGDRRWGRRLIGMIGHGSALVCWLTAPFAPTAFWFFAAASMAGFCMDLTMGASWSACQDVGRRYAAIVAGFMNMIGNLGGAIANVVTGKIANYTLALYAAREGLAMEALSAQQKAEGALPGYRIALFTFAAAFVIGILCWSQIDASKPAVPEEEAHGR